MSDEDDALGWYVATSRAWLQRRDGQPPTTTVTVRSVQSARGTTLGRSLAVLTVFIAFGCGASADRTQADLEPVPPTPATLEIEVGVGVESFQPVLEGESVDLTYGPQGGFHVWVAVRTRDLTVERAQINVSIRYVTSGASAGPPSRWPAALLLDEGSRSYAGMRGFIQDAAQVNGKAVVLRAEVIAIDGRHGAAERIVVPTLK